MRKKYSKNREFTHFEELSNEWWDENGKFKVLHRINPIRIEYIKKQMLSKNQKNNNYNKKLANLEILDLGCGGGIICEPLSRLGAKVTGIDFVKKNIEVAKHHAKNSKLKINYSSQDLNSFNTIKKYDLILMLEIIEHLENWQFVVKKILKNLKSNGKIIFSTINRTIYAKFFAIYMAEEILEIIPKKTHQYEKLIQPNELKQFLRKNNLDIIDTTGLVFNPLKNKWNLDKNKIKINYFCTAKKIS